jgi:hypothetical protein
MKRAFLATALLALGMSAGACGSPPQPNWSGATDDVVTPQLIAAMKEEAIGDPAKAEGMYVDLLDDAMYSSPWELAVAEASIDALITRDVYGLSEISDRTALAYRTRDAAFFDVDHPEIIAGRMPRIFRIQQDSIKKGVIARGMMQLAEQRGNWADAERWRSASGCAREATLFGPVSWTSIIGVREIQLNGLEKFDAPVPANFKTPGPFGAAQPPLVVRGRGCAIDLAAISPRNGTRTVVVDVDVRRKQTIAVGLRAHGEAQLRVGGLVAITQPYELGSTEAARFAKVEVEPGRLRLVAVAGMNEDGDKIEISAFTDEGDPLVAHAPHPGERANARALSVDPLVTPEPKNNSQRVALALASLAEGDARTAENMLEEAAKAPDAPPELLLTYARAVSSARDLSAVHRADRARGAYERVIDAWPSSWEAVIAHGVLAGVKRGESDARIETLKDIDTHRAKASKSGAALMNAFDAALSGRERLYGRAADAFARAKADLDRTALLHDVEHEAFVRSDDDAARFACSANPPNDRASFDCYSALHSKGDLIGASREIERLRALLGAPDLFAALAVRDATIRGDREGARDAFEALFPGERSVSAIASFAADPKDRERTPKEIRAAVLTVAPIARDAPASLTAVLGSLGDDQAKDFDAQALDVTRRDREHPLVEGAATATLAHVERYEIMPSGVFHYVLFDVRRVNGTADVDENAQADAPDFDGRTSFRILRKRILKKDGRVLEPDSAPNAAQGHADLSQLEQGDSIEAVYEGWGVPSDTGDVGIDTPDLLPDRVAVANASIEIRLPASLAVHMWQHPILGKPAETRDGSTRVLKWNLEKHGVRHLEDGTPKMDRSVGVSLSTAEWSTVALALRETQASLVDHHPEVAAWAHDAAKLVPKEKPSAKTVEAIVRAAGDAVHEASPAILSDIGAAGARGPQSMTARTILTDHEGSRTWLIVRALRELGVKVDIAVAENEPFSADPAFPAHFGRFLHPLAIAHVPDASGKLADIWIDADVEGPPLPAGHLSPELRGRSLLHDDGTIDVVPNVGSAEDAKDEIDIRLVLDDAGNAKGDVTALLRGRAAQEIAEALTRVVGFERERALRNVVLGWVPYANVNEVALSSSEGSWQIALRASITVSSYAQVEQTSASQKSWILPGIDPVHYVFPRPGVSTLSSTYASERARESALAIGHAIQYHAHRRIELPSGAKVSRLPGPFEIKGSSLGASRKIAVAGSSIEDDFSLSVATGTIAPKDYAAFVDSARRADDAFLSSTRVTPAK